MNRQQVSTPALPPVRKQPSRTTRAVDALLRWLWRLGRAVVRLTWRNRWHVAPVAGVLTCVAGDPLVAGSLSIIVGVLAHGWGRSGKDVGRRALLSVRERYLLRDWCGGVLAWAVLVTPFGPGLAISGACLAAATGWQTWQWWTSRRLRLGLMLGRSSSAYAGEWAAVAAGRVELAGSVVVRESIQVLDGDGATFRVQLDGVHAEDAATSIVRRHVEAKLKPSGKRLGTGTVTVAQVRDDASQVEVTVTPQRILEIRPVPWQGAVVNRDGSVTCATGVNGRRHAVHTRNEDGVEHLVFVGASGTGKSTTAAVIYLPLIKARQEVVWVVDGGAGSSLPDLDPVLDWRAYDPAQARRCIRAAHAVMVGRQQRRRGAKRWRDEDDPILRLHFEETPTVVQWIGAGEVAMVLQIAREGRKQGVGLGQSAQDLIAQWFIGGALARAQLPGNGTVIGHRVSSQTTSERATEASREIVDLRALPEEPGFVRLIRRSKPVPGVLRIDNPSDELLEAEVASVGEPRALAGADAEDARRHGYDQRAEENPEDGDAAQEGPVAVSDPNAKGKVYAVLANAAYAAGTGAADTAEVPTGSISGTAGVSPSSVAEALKQLAAEGKAVKVRHGFWAATVTPEVEEPSETVIGDGAVIVGAGDPATSA